MTSVMGVLNVTPDSFSDGGAYAAAAAAILRGRELHAQGAHFVDVGGESTRPGATPVPRPEELRRVIPVIEGLTEAGVPVSVDTLHAETADAALRAGAVMVNDVSGGTFDPDLLGVVANSSADLVLGHWRGVPDPAQLRSNYADVVFEVRDALAAQAERAIQAGIPAERIVLDPGLGFDKTGAQCWQLLAALPELSALGYRVLVGASRKRMLAELMATLPSPEDHASPVDRDLATSVVSALAHQAGAWGVRVHNVRGTVEALAVAQAWQASAVAGRPMTDRITLRGLEVFAHHGVFDFEREAGQRFSIDADITLDLVAAASSDDLTNTVHYGALAEALQAAVQRDPVDLIETVAERAADVALGFAGVTSARITVHKPDAPIGIPFADVSVTVVRQADPHPRSEQ